MLYQAPVDESLSVIPHENQPHFIYFLFGISFALFTRDPPFVRFNFKDSDGFRKE